MQATHVIGLMEIHSVTLQWRRVILAAVRLAALYALGVAILIVAVSAVAFHDRPMASELPYFGIPLLVAFVVLAVARRAGFALLWTLLAALWVYILNENEFVGLAFPPMFLSWSAFAAPLFAIGALGFGTSADASPPRRRIPRPVLIAAAWGALAGVSIYLGNASWVWLSYPDSAVALNGLGWLFWFPAPFVIAVVELRRVWVATSPSASEAPAA
jgi:hypothetical protein